MNRFIKLLSLLIISLSIFWVYQKTKDSHYQIMSIGDNYSIGITSYGVKEDSYLDYIKRELLKTKKEVEINKKYNQIDQSIQNSILMLKQTRNIKKDLYDTNLLILSLGYNDVLYALSLEENPNQKQINSIMNQISKNYNELIKEIRKYYHEKIVVVGYIEDDRYDSNKQIGIQKLNEILKSNQEVVYIDTNILLKERKKYFSNPQNNYPNSIGYKCIANKIIQKTLENKENI